MSVKYEYSVRTKRELVTNIGPDPTEFTQSFLNELGQNGELVVNIGEHQEPSGIQDVSQREIPYYVVTVLTARKIEEDES